MFLSQSVRSNAKLHFSRKFVNLSRPFQIVEENKELGKYLEAVSKSPIFQNLNQVAFQHLAKKYRSTIKNDIIAPFELEAYLLTSVDKRRLLCIHEAGHVVTTRLNPIWRRIVLSVHMSQPSITITQAREKYVEDCWLSNRTLVIGELTNILGGIAAEEIFYEGSCLSKGVKPDLLAFAETATMHVFERGIPNIYSECAHTAYIEELYNEASYISTAVVKRHKDKISLMAKELYSVDRMGSDRIEEILFSEDRIQKSFKNGHICSPRREPAVHEPPAFLKLRQIVKETLTQLYIATTPNVPSPIPLSTPPTQKESRMDGVNREVSLPQSSKTKDGPEDRDRLRKSIHEMGHAIVIRTNPIKSYSIKSISLSEDNGSEESRKGKIFSVGSSTIIADPPLPRRSTPTDLPVRDKKMNKWQHDREYLKSVIINHLGGIAAELVLYGRKINTIRFESDIDICAEVMARSTVLTGGYKSSEEQTEYVKRFSKELHNEAIKICEALVEKHKEKLLVLAKELCASGRLDGARINEVLFPAPQPLPTKVEASWMDWLLSKM